MLEHWEDDMDNWGTDLEPGECAPLEDLIALHTAASVEELWRALVVRPGLRGGQSFEAVGLFKKHHGHGTPTRCARHSCCAPTGAGISRVAPD